MAKKFTKEHLSTIINAIYKSSTSPVGNQKTLKELQKETNVSVNTLIKVRSILCNMKLLVIIGPRNSQHSFWNPDYSTPNSSMVSEVFRVYTQDPKVAKNQHKVQKLPSFEMALRAIASKNWQKLTVETVQNNKTVIEIYDLTNL